MSWRSAWPVAGQHRLMRLRRPPLRSPDHQQPAILTPQLHHDGLTQRRVRQAVEEDDPPVVGAAFAFACAGDVHDFVLAEAEIARAEDRKRAMSGIDRENPSLRPRRILEAGEREKKHRTDGNPHEVDRRKEAPNHLAMIRVVTRDEIQQKLIGIVLQEKDVAQELLKPETALADAGIDSLDSLTILFAIEEQFRISIPDDRARAMKTFGDMVDMVADLLAGSQN